VFIPTSAVDYDQASLTRLRSAFCIPPPSAGLENRQELNKLLLIAPPHQDVLADENGAFTTYWHALLSDPAKIASIARGLFTFRINNPGNRF
jgi:hypothetical protein